jgi:hypothetical protein
MRPSREEALRIIRANRVAGNDTRHSRADNLRAVEELAKGLPNVTLGIHGVARFQPYEILDAVAAITRCSNNLGLRSGQGYIDPEATLDGLTEAGQRIAGTASGGGRIVLATGHPGSLLWFYLELHRLISAWGGRPLEAGRGLPVPPYYELDYIQGVAVLTDRATIWHTHEPKGGELILEAATQIDLAVADHGYAGAMINAGVPVVTVMDTNDPGIAMARHIGADVTIIPMDDNRPLGAYPPIAHLLGQLAEADRSIRSGHTKTRSPAA